MKKALLLFTFILALLVGCTDTSTDPIMQGKSNLKVYLVDSPASLDSVIINVKRVEIHKDGSDSTSGWITINNTLRSFDLLQLRNGASAVLGDSVLPPGHYSQIRLILADGSYVINEGIKYNLTVPSGFQTGIKLNHEFTLEADKLYELVLDFNVDKSIHTTGNGKYMMNPVIRVMPIVTSGSISGQVLPLEAQATVFAYTGSDTISTYPDENGFFKLMVLPQGSYNIGITPLDSTVYKDSTITDVNVIANQNTDLGIIELKLK